MSRSDEGSVLVLGLGLAVLGLLLVGGVVDASRLFLARAALASLADGAALRGADDVDVAALYGGGGRGGVLPLSAQRVRADVTAYVAATATANGMRGVRVDAVTARAGVVTVQLSMDETVPLLGPLVGAPDGVLVTAQASARTAAL